MLHWIYQWQECWESAWVTRLAPAARLGGWEEVLCHRGCRGWQGPLLPSPATTAVSTCSATRRLWLPSPTSLRTAAKRAHMLHAAMDSGVVSPCTERGTWRADIQGLTQMHHRPPAGGRVCCTQGVGTLGDCCGKVLLPGAQGGC